MSPSFRHGTVVATLLACQTTTFAAGAATAGFDPRQLFAPLQLSTPGLPDADRSNNRFVFAKR